MALQIVMDTNVLMSALRSRLGASFRLLSLVGRDLFEMNVSVPLVLEYEETGKRLAGDVGLTHADIDDVLDYVCGVSHHRRIHFLVSPA